MRGSGVFFRVPCRLLGGRRLHLWCGRAAMLCPLFGRVLVWTGLIVGVFWLCLGLVLWEFGCCNVVGVFLGMQLVL